MAEKVVIATRRSRLALWQAEHVKARLEALHAGLRVELLPLSTRGDELLEATLAKAGGKGLFVKELEAALAERRADRTRSGADAQGASIVAVSLSPLLTHTSR